MIRHKMPHFESKDDIKVTARNGQTPYKSPSSYEDVTCVPTNLHTSTKLSYNNNMKNCFFTYVLNFCCFFFPFVCLLYFFK